MENLNIGQHISRRYNEELEDIRNRVLAMGGLVEQQLKDAMTALEKRDAGLAAQVVERDCEVNAMEVAIDEECNRVLARRQPAASDLRLVVAVIKTITDLERIGDEAERIARMVSTLVREEHSTRLFTQIRNLGHHVSSMVHGALDAFAHLDTEKSVEVWSEDRLVDDEYDSLMRELMTYMMEDPRSIPSILQAMFAARAMERIGDRAGNICEYVIYLVKGKDVRHTRVDKSG
ncbi:PhoU-like phosphate uptake regulator [Thiogranum longum]|uniref:Phosphate-specific transport system accessory protein PhoU n=1 Tax=Thiogranum longum TaxID=1537524 RepID=A0A4V2PH30_9GAMM|nr:phosphate signaling complex protein PhoU [Thiogranum longum]TCK19116.1 PhoU-like phosphate uptake regulator [Thiogranum longum]